MCLLFAASAANAANTFPFVSCPVVAPDIVSPSCFEGLDGNLAVNDVAGDRIDWASVVGIPQPATQYQDPRNPIDDVFKASTAKEDTPGDWQIEIDKAPSKSDILNTVFYTQQVPELPGHIFLYGGFENTAGGNVNVSFELNHGAANGDLTFNNGHSVVPYRSENDVLITYDGTINNVTIGLCFWHGNNLAGNWFSQPDGGGVGLGGNVKTCPTLDHTQAEGNINGADLPNTILNQFSNPIPMGDFGEVAVNLTTSIGSGNNLCFALGGIWMHSRSSSQANSTMEDYIVPQHINGANSCAQTVEKKVAKGTAASDPTGLTYADSLSAADGDWLYYTLTAENTGTQPITHGAGVAGPAISDPNCVSIVSGPGAPTAGAGTTTVADDVPPDTDKFHRQANNSLVADSTPTTYDGRDVWVFRCKHLYNVANDGNSYVNTVTANGSVGTFTVPQQTDHADAAVIAPGQVRAAKTVVGGAGGETWDFTVAGVTKAAIGDGGTTSTESVPAGQQTSISEDGLAAGSGTFLVTDVTCTKVGGGAVTYTPHLVSGTVDVTPAAGEDITCTFTNTKQPRIRAGKTVVGGHGGETFDFTVAGTAEPAIADAAQTAYETVVPGQAATISGDTLNAGGGTFDLTDITCTGTNGVVTKDLVNKTVDVTPAAGEDVTCTFTNTRRATVKAAKTVSGGKGGETFPLTVNAVATPGVGNGQSTLAEVIVPNTQITVSEGAQDGGPAGTFTSAVSCLDGQGGAVATANQTTTAIDVTPAAGQEITCTFTNRRAPDPPAPAGGGGPAPAHPRISIDKVGPAQALAGSAIVYGIGVTNTGDQSFAEQALVVTDPLCEAPPTLVGKLGDKTPGSLDPGETWGYSCTVQTAVGQAAVHNIAAVSGVDPHGATVTASDPADTVLVQPDVQVLPETIRLASAKLRGPNGCVASRKPSRAVVTGKRIASVTFLVDGKAVKTIRSGNFVLKLDARRFNYDKHRVTARVTFLPGSNLKTKTLKFSFGRCRPTIVQPKFTG